MKEVFFLLLTSLTAAQASPDGVGVCVGDLFLRADASAQTRHGPDFTVHYFTTSRGPVGVYVGCCSQVHDAKRNRFGSVEGLGVFRVSEDKIFRGYLIETITRFEGTNFHTQYHFFGEGFVDGREDRAFFQRLSVSDGASYKCGRNAAA